MIALFASGKRLRAAQEEIALLKQQLAVLSAEVASLARPEETALLQQQFAALLTQVTALAAQSMAEGERATVAGGQARLVQERLEALEATTTRQAAAAYERADAQLARIEALRGQVSSNEEAVKQGRGALARIEKQVEADLAELRRFDAVVATTILRGRDPAATGGEPRHAADA